MANVPLTVTVWVALLPGAPTVQEKPVRLRFDVQHMPATPDGKPRPLEPKEIRAFEAEVKGLPGVKEATCSESSVTITVDPDGRLRLSDLRAAGKKTLGTEAGKPVIVFNTVKLEGRVSITLHVEKNPEKVKEALKGFGEALAESGETHDLKVKSPVPVLTVVKAVAARCGVEYKVFDILKDIVWHGTSKGPEK